MTTLSSNAERLAEMAESLPAFSGLKLAHLKLQLTRLLSLIGRDGIFDEYSNHDISHIDKMLALLDWLIPEQTKEIMTPVDWLLTVLAIYLHDLGMLVTKREYEQRNSSEFPTFRDRNLFAGDTGEDYRIKVQKLGPDRGERFAYQEFVRAKHAERIRAWILGIERSHLGISTEVFLELDELLAPLTTQFRKDLAVVCESHHLTDLDDIKKYKISQPYGDSDDETANVQYAAVLMRTADLLHITSDRTPSISFRVINPTDPISQDEWAKQMAVRRIRPQIGRDKEGNPDEDAPRDTIEVHADFKKEDGFFGLTAYLQYVQEQLERSHEWIVESNRSYASKYKFPWRYIDDTHVETEGFLKETFEFTLDQGRILDLLTGHTLYNDIKIVLRELVQNAIDAVRLQYLIDSKASENPLIGAVQIHWDTSSRTLSITDNGTGMTQSIIERNLLKVGASRYQSDDFKSEFPEFSSISRFGIGILSTFMIADSVEIITAHPDNERARQLSLRSVHGKYLIRLLDKHTDSAAKALTPHGTTIHLRVRPSVDMSDILETAKRWIVLPKCSVTLSVDDDPPSRVGFSSCKEALEDYLRELDVSVDEVLGDQGRKRVRIIEQKQNNVTLAYAVIWSEYFRQWSFYTGRFGYDPEETEEPDVLGICVEGIRVEFNTPGFNGYNIVAIANTEGLTAPKTNVARSGLESTLERDNMLSALYAIFCNHVKKELEELYTKRSFSLTWAVQEARFLLSPLLISRSRPTQPSLLYDEVQKTPVLLIEHNRDRKAVAPIIFRDEPVFWTIDGALLRSSEALIRELPINTSLSALVSALNTDSLQLPVEPLLCGDEADSLPTSFAYTGKEVISIEVHRDQRRVDLKWGTVSSTPRWRSLPRSLGRRVRSLARDQRKLDIRKILVGQQAVQTTGILEDEIAVRAFGYSYLLPGSGVAQKLVQALDEWQAHPDSSRAGDMALFLFEVVGLLLRGTLDPPVDVKTLQEHAVERRFSLEEEIYRGDLIRVLNESGWRVFDPTRWARGYDGEY